MNMSFLVKERILLLVAAFSCCDYCVSADQEVPFSSSGSYFISYGKNSALKRHVVDTSIVSSFLDCGLKCVSLEPDCKSFNYVESSGKLPSCELNNVTIHCVQEQDFIHQSDSQYAELVTAAMDETCSVCENGGKYQVTSRQPGFKCVCKKYFKGERCQEYPICQNMKEEQPSTILISLGGSAVKVFCDAREQAGGWTLVARFSNKDSKHWMEDQGTWWYDKVEPYGKPLDPGDNADMISEAFSLMSGTEFKITRSDDSTHTALLTTTGNCLEGKTFRSKMASFGTFRGTTTWAITTCRGRCSVVYGGNYTTTTGFSQSQCDDYLQSRNNIGFWCDYGDGDGSVLMIGGGGNYCERADHGIGVTNEKAARFKGLEEENDFGDDSAAFVEQSYALNLWIR